MTSAGMKNGMTLVIGGARSGKSSFAQGLAASLSPAVCFVATAEAGDGEMSERIARHREERPAGWTTVELAEGLPVPEITPGTDTALLDCFTVYLSRLMAASGLDWAPEAEDAMPETEVVERMEETEERALETVTELRLRVPRLIIVTNEVGQGLVPPYRLGRIFRDIAGRVNQCLAAAADEVYLVTAGMPARLKGDD